MKLEYLHQDNAKLNWNKSMNKSLIIVCISILCNFLSSCNNCPEEVPFCEKEKEDNTTSTLWLLALTGQASSSSSSEEATIEISGTAKDSNENVISNGTVSVSKSSSSSNQSRATVTNSTITDASGNFTLYLKVAKFTITIKKSDGTEIGSFELDIQNTTDQHIIPSNISGLSITLNSAVSIGNNTDLLGISCFGSTNTHEWGTFCDNKDGTIPLYATGNTGYDWNNIYQNDNLTIELNGQSLNGIRDAFIVKYR